MYVVKTIGLHPFSDIARCSAVSCMVRLLFENPLGIKSRVYRFERSRVDRRFDSESMQFLETLDMDPQSVVRPRLETSRHPV